MKTMQKLNPNAERGKMAVILLWVMVALELATFISEAMQYMMIQDFFETGDITDVAADSNDMRQAIIYVVYLGGFIICIITFLSWFRRAYYNLGLRENKSKTDGWAVGAWFIPILNLFWPYQIMVELYEKTTKYINSKHPGSYNYTAKTTVFVGWWWAFWILNNIMGQVVSRVTLDAESLEDLSLDSQLSMANAVLGILAALFAVKVVRDYMKIEEVYYTVAHELPIVTHEVSLTSTTDSSIITEEE